MYRYRLHMCSRRTCQPSQGFWKTYWTVRFLDAIYNVGDALKGNGGSLGMFNYYVMRVRLTNVDAGMTIPVIGYLLSMTGTELPDVPTLQGDWASTCHTT